MNTDINYGILHQANDTTTVLRQFITLDLREMCEAGGASYG